MNASLFIYRAKVVHPRTLKIFNPEIILISDVVCRYFNVNIDDLRKKNRKEELVTPRWFISFFSSYFTHNKDKNIGYYLKRDRSNIAHARDKIIDLLAYDKKIKFQYKVLSDMILQNLSDQDYVKYKKSQIKL